MRSGKPSFQIVRFVLLLTRALPLKWAYGFCTFVVFIGSRLRWKRKSIALSNLKIVFPEKSDAERKSILRESLRNRLKDYFEMAYVINGKYKAKQILPMVSARGLENLDKLVQSGQGALLYSGHFGNFALMFTWLALKGYPIAAIYKEAKNFPDDFFGNVMRRLNVTPLKFRSDAHITVEVIKALKEKKIVLIMNDQSHPLGVYINFFGKSVPSPAGPALLAKRTGVPIIPAYIYRDRSNHHHIEVLPEMQLIPENDMQKFLLINTQLMLDWIAELLLKHPTEWLWLHNRWKRAKE